MAVIATLNTVFNATTAGFEKGCKAGIDVLQKFEASIFSVNGALGALGVGLSTAAFASAVKGSMDTVDELAKVSDRLGIATESLGGLQYAAELAGSDTETFNKGLEKMTVKLAEASGGSKEAIQAFAQVGLKASELRGLSLDEVFLKISDAINALPTPAARANAAMDLFGKSGVGLLNTIALGSKGLNAATKEFENLGAAVTRMDAAKIEEANDAISRIGTAVQGAVQKIAIALAPFIEKLSNGLAVAIANIGDWGKVVASWAPAFTRVGIAITAVLTTLAAFRAALKGIATAQAIVLGLTGPGGWAKLAAGIVIAGGALYGVERLFEQVEDGAKSAKVSVEGLNAALASAPKTNYDAMIPKEFTKLRKMDESLTREMELASLGLARTGFNTPDAYEIIKETEEFVKVIKARNKALGLGEKLGHGDFAKVARRRDDLIAIKAKERQIEAVKQINAIIMEGAMAGMSAEEKKLQLLQRQGVTMQKIEAARRAMYRQEQVDREKANQDLSRSQFISLQDSMLTPLEKYEKRLKELEELQSKLVGNAATDPSFDRARLAALSDLNEAVSPHSANNVALQRGTAAAHAAEGDPKNNPVLKTSKEILAEAKRQGVTLKQQLTAFKNHGLLGHPL